MNSLIFFGSDQYSAIVLKAIISSKLTPTITVVTDHQVGGTEVAKLAKERDLKVSYYPDFDQSLITKDILGVCASFDHLIPKEIIEKFGGNLYNLHPSLLPQYRNVSPVQYAIALGDKETGITLFRISTGIDNGKIIAQASEPILDTDTTPTLTSRLFQKGADLFLQGYKGRNLVEQTSPLIFTHRLTRNSGFVEWSVLQKLLTNQRVQPDETKNELLYLRLGSDLKGRAQPRPNDLRGRSDPLGTRIIHDLTRALTPWPGIWSTVPTKNGDLRISLISHTGYVIPEILISGKPKPISWSDFTQYYL